MPVIIFRSLFEMAVRDDVIRKNPTKGVMAEIIEAKRQQREPVIIPENEFYLRKRMGRKSPILDAIYYNKKASMQRYMQQNRVLRYRVIV